MLFDWDKAKAASNIVKHGVAFEAVHDFEFDSALIVDDDRRDYGELRKRAYGRIGDILYVLVFTQRAARIRVISLRRASRREFAIIKTRKPGSVRDRRMTRLTHRRPLIEPTEEEDAAITAAAASDPDARELTDEDLAGLRPFAEVYPELVRRRGPQRAPTKMQVSIRLDRDVVDRFRRDGPGWQARMNQVLRQAAGLDR